MAENSISHKEMCSDDEVSDLSKDPLYLSNNEPREQNNVVRIAEMTRDAIMVATADSVLDVIIASLSKIIDQSAGSYRVSCHTLGQEYEIR